MLWLIVADTMVQDLEFSQVERQVLDGLKEGNEALKKANEMFSIEEIEQIMDDTAEAAEKVGTSNFGKVMSPTYLDIE